MAEHDRSMSKAITAPAWPPSFVTQAFVHDADARGLGRVFSQQRTTARSALRGRDGRAAAHARAGLHDNSADDPFMVVRRERIAQHLADVASPQSLLASYLSRNMLVNAPEANTPTLTAGILRSPP